MWQYSKKLEYPVKIKKANPAMAKLIISQLGGPDGETGAALRYLSQRYGMPSDKVKGCLLYTSLRLFDTPGCKRYGARLFIYDIIGVHIIV